MVNADLLEGLKSLIREAVREELDERPDNRRDDDLELLTVDDVTALLKFSNRQSVYKLRREGELQAVNLGGDDGKTIRFRRSEVRRFIAEHLEQNGCGSRESNFDTRRND